MNRVLGKLREIAASELAAADKVLYAAYIAAGVGSAKRRFRLKGGGCIELRADTTDRKVFDEIYLARVYAPFAELSKRGRAPLALIDLGANTGLSAISLARTLRPDWIVAVEPDPSNYAMLLRNVSLAGIADHFAAIQAFAGAERGYARLEDSGNGAWGMRMGTAASSGITVLPVAEIVAMAPLPARVILKCDIEGAERYIFEHMRDWEHLTSFVMLELHTEFFAEEEFRACIESSGYYWRLYGTISRDSVLAVVGLERLERKPTLQRATGS